MEITTEYSSWYIIGCAVLAGLYTFFLYWKNKQNADVSKTIVRFLSVLRFVTVFILAFLLLNPMIQKWITKTESPVIIVAQDVSASILNNKDSLYYQTDYLKELESLNQQISENFEVVFMPFGGEVLSDSIDISFNEKRTSFSNVFDEVNVRYAGDNIGAVILASDGLFNMGSNPTYYNFKKNYPIYTVGLGDSTVKSDISIQDVQANDIVYLGNDFPLNIGIQANLLKGKEAILKISKNGKSVKERIIKINENADYYTEKFVITTEKEGTQRYQISVTSFENELNTRNNTRDLLIDVIDNRDKVLILGNAPHPDISAIRSVLEKQENVELDVAIVGSSKLNFSSYNLVIAHGFGENTNFKTWQRLWETPIPVWLIIKGATGLNVVNRFNPGFTLEGASKKSNLMTPALNDDFSYFKMSEAVKEFLNECPPLMVSHGEISVPRGTDVLMYQKLGAVETSFPMQQFGYRESIKTGWLFGEGVWQWKMYDNQQSKSQERFSEWVSKTVQFLSVKEDKSRFRIVHKKHFLESENVVIDAELYDKSYALQNSSEVQLMLENEDNETFNYVFNSIGNKYSLDLGKLKSGVYSYVAKTQQGGDDLFKSGQFIVKPLNVEWQKVSADFSLLEALSEKTGGIFYLPNQLNELASVFQSKKAFPAISYTTEIKKSILHEKWIFFLLLFLLTMEWVVRKYKGRY